MNSLLHYCGVILLLCTFSVNTIAQKNTANPLQSIDGIIDQLLDQITIEQGETMDTTAIRNLFYPKALLTVASSEGPETVSLDDFLVLLKDPYYEAGYLEKALHRITEQYNGIAHVFETFYGKDSEGQEDRGMNSYQLTYYQDRWWIVSMLWTVEAKNDPIPTKYGG